MNDKNVGIVKAIAAVNGVDRLATELAVTPAAIYRWRDRIDRVPAERCVQIEAITHGLVRCEDLRPDVGWAVLRASSRRKPVRAAA